MVEQVHVTDTSAIEGEATGNSVVSALAALGNSPNIDASVMATVNLLVAQAQAANVPVATQTAAANIASSLVTQVNTAVQTAINTAQAQKIITPEQAETLRKPPQSESAAVAESAAFAAGGAQSSAAAQSVAFDAKSEAPVTSSSVDVTAAQPVSAAAAMAAATQSTDASAPATPTVSGAAAVATAGTDEAPTNVSFTQIVQAGKPADPKTERALEQAGITPKTTGAGIAA